MTIENAIRVSNENEIDKSESNAINQDWPNLSFYEEDNFKLKSKTWKKTKFPRQSPLNAHKL